MCPCWRFSRIIVLRFSVPAGNLILSKTVFGRAPLAIGYIMGEFLTLHAALFELF